MAASFGGQAITGQLRMCNFEVIWAHHFTIWAGALAQRVVQYVVRYNLKRTVIRAGDLRKLVAVLVSRNL